MVYVFVCIFELVGIIVILVGIGKSRLRTSVAAIPTSQIRNLVDGQYAEIKGIVCCEKPLILRGADEDIQCVYYHYQIEDTKRSSKKGSDLIGSHDDYTTFTLTDASGSVTVNPENAAFDAPVVLTSRADSMESKLLSIAGAVLMVNRIREIRLKIGKVHY